MPASFTKLEWARVVNLCRADLIACRISSRNKLMAAACEFSVEAEERMGAALKNGWAMEDEMAARVSVLRSNIEQKLEEFHKGLEKGDRVNIFVLKRPYVVELHVGTFICADGIRGLVIGFDDGSCQHYPSSEIYPDVYDEEKGLIVKAQEKKNVSQELDRYEFASDWFFVKSSFMEYSAKVLGAKAKDDAEIDKLSSQRWEKATKQGKVVRKKRTASKRRSLKRGSTINAGGNKASKRARNAAAFGEVKQGGEAFGADGDQGDIESVDAVGSDRSD